ncbi:MAG: hypothetical protein FWC08_01785 [Defluviitaleaceae bacterium]|nr:hypothetical protein [Defluviitaleaceae bacterium]
MNKKILPIVSFPIITDNSLNAILCAAEPKYIEKWIINSNDFLQIVFDEKEKDIMFEESEINIFNSNLFNDSAIPVFKDTLLECRNDVFNIVKKMIGSEYYCYTFINTNDLITWRSKNKQFSCRKLSFEEDTNVLIYGYDDDGKQLHIAGINKKHEFLTEKINYDDFFSYWMSAKQSRIYIHFFKFKNELKNCFDPIKFKNNLNKYINPYEDKNDKTYGLKAFEKMIPYMLYLNNKKVSCLNCYTFIYSHKKLLHARINLLIENFFLNNSFNVRFEKIKMCAYELLMTYNKHLQKANSLSLNKSLRKMEISFKEEHDLLLEVYKNLN